MSDTDKLTTALHVMNTTLSSNPDAPPLYVRRSKKVAETHEVAQRKMDKMEQLKSALREKRREE